MFFSSKINIILCKKSTFICYGTNIGTNITILTWNLLIFGFDSKYGIFSKKILSDTDQEWTHYGNQSKRYPSWPNFGFRIKQIWPFYTHNCSICKNHSFSFHLLGCLVLISTNHHNACLFNYRSFVCEPVYQCGQKFYIITLPVNWSKQCKKYNLNSNF